MCEIPIKLNTIHAKYLITRMISKIISKKPYGYDATTVTFGWTIELTFHCDVHFVHVGGQIRSL